MQRVPRAVLGTGRWAEGPDFVSCYTGRGNTLDPREARKPVKEMKW